MIKTTDILQPSGRISSKVYKTGVHIHRPSLIWNHIFIYFSVFWQNITKRGGQNEKACGGENTRAAAVITAPGLSCILVSNAWIAGADVATNVALSYANCFIIYDWYVTQRQRTKLQSVFWTAQHWSEILRCVSAGPTLLPQCVTAEEKKNCRTNDWLTISTAHCEVPNKDSGISTDRLTDSYDT
jgi:hypothetical protein